MDGFLVSADKLDRTALAAAMQDDSAGAFVCFEGWVRDNNEGHAVTALEYEVFRDLAVTEGGKIIGEAIGTFGLTDARAVHREGPLEIGDCAIWIGVTARHRGAAFDACRYIIDEIKHRLPVWKKEHYEGLDPQWVNCQHHHHHAPQPDIAAEEYYARQMRLPEIGAQGQARLRDARVLIVGVGGLGSAATVALAGAGIGTIGLADHDTLAVSNLHRQMIYDAADAGKPKAGLAAARLRALNPLIALEVHAEKVTADNVRDLFAPYDLVLDCTDNFTAKYLLNDAAILYGRPVIQASIYRFEGQLLTIDPSKDDGCLRCLFPEPPAPGMVGDCAEVGVLGTVPMLFGTLQANEAIKHLLGLETSADLTTFDLLSLTSQRIARRRRADCALCGAHPSITGPSPAIDVVVRPQDTLADLRDRYVFVDVREDWEVAARPVEDALHMPMSAFDTACLRDAGDKPLLLICAKGVRSLAAAEYLRREGWGRAYNLAGGMDSLPSGRTGT